MGKEGLSRRDFLRFAVRGSAALGAAMVIGPELYSYYLEQERLSHLPPEILVLRQSVSWGIAPDKNNLDLLQPYRDVAMNGHLLFVWHQDAIDAICDKVEELNADHMHPMVSWGPPGHTTFGARQTLKDIWARKDTRLYLEDAAKKIARRKIKFSLIYQPEPNGDWYAAYGSRYNTPQEFISSWRETHAIFQQAGANDFIEWVFCVNTTDIAKPIEPYYPGNDVVGACGLDGYNKSTMNPANIKRLLFPNLSPKALFGPDIGTLRRIAKGKKIYITEYNTAREGDKTQWLAKMFELAKYGVSKFNLYNWNRKDYEGIDWRMEKDPKNASTIRGILSGDWFIHPQAA